LIGIIKIPGRATGSDFIKVPSGGGFQINIGENVFIGVGPAMKVGINPAP
jgi:hypothetical protein